MKDLLVQIAILSCFLFGILFSSCRWEKEINDNNKLLDQVKSLNSNIFRLPSSNDTTIIGDKNTKIDIPDNAFMDKSNNEYEGFFDLILTECYTRRDILESGISTSSSGELLVSFGFIFLEAKDTMGNELKLRNNIELSVYLDTAYFENGYSPKVFYGNIDANSNEFNWVQDSSFTTDELIKFTEKRDTIFGELTGFKIDVPKLGWINLDSFFDLPPERKSNLIVKVNQDYGFPVKLVLKDIRSVVDESLSENGMVEFEGLPKGEKAILFTYGIEDETPFYASKEIVIGRDVRTKLNIEQCTMEELEQKFREFEY